jgi:hypothetical protein
MRTREGGGAAGVTEYGSKHWWGEAFKTSLTPADLVCVTFTNSVAKSVRDLTGAPGWTCGFEELDSFGMEDSSCHRRGTGLERAPYRSGTVPSSGEQLEESSFMRLKSHLANKFWSQHHQKANSSQPHPTRAIFARI